MSARSLPPADAAVARLLAHIDCAQARLGILEEESRTLRRELNTAREALADVARSALHHANSNSKEVPCNNTKM